jgi:uncharacterized membrane protein YesL
VTGVRLIGRGLSDTLEHLLTFTLYSLTWWLGVFLIVTAPAATMALFTMTDPRLAIAHPELKEAFRTVRQRFRHGWAIALLTVPVPLVLANNLIFYGGSDSFFGWLAPFWLFLLVLSLAATLATFSVAALTDARPLTALKTGALLTAVHPLRAGIVVVLLWILLAIGGALVVPLVMFLPATVTATINRFVLTGLRIDIPDPLKPTEERLREELGKKRSKRFGP